MQNDLANPAGTVAKLVKENKSSAEIVEELYLRTFSRQPTAEERNDAIALVDEADNGGTGNAGAAEGRQQAIEDLLWTLLNSKEFVFNH